MINFTVTGENENTRISLETTEHGGITEAVLSVQFAEQVVPEKVQVSWKFAAADCYSTWSPSIRDNHSIQPNWDPRRTFSELARWMPLHQLISESGTNRLCIAVSDVCSPISIQTGINEFDSQLDCAVNFFIRPVAPIKEYCAVIRLDLRELPFYDSIYQTVDWWEKDCGYTPMSVPEAAREPMNSLWYSYHHDLQPDVIVKQCAMAKEFGMQTVIIDDGWQMDESANVSGVYAYCGDWQVSQKKIGDMRRLVERIHETGTKAILWFSMPFIGIKSKNFKRFEHMLLEGSGDGRTYFSLDIRYRCVREYLIDFYVKAVREWGFDGLKLDFIDSFSVNAKTAIAGKGCDCSSIEDAVLALLDNTKQRLTAINPEIMIEFRQSYIGPAIRQYGNMLRVGDCPLDAIKNQMDIVNLRLTSGKTAVHSDMLMWDYNDSVESAAQQLASVLYSVPQISVRLEELPESHCRMLKFYLDFWRKYRSVLLDGKLTAENPECNYSSVTASDGETSIVTVYADSVVDCTAACTIAVNVAKGQGLIFEHCQSKQYCVLDCMGQKLENGVFSADLQRLKVPLSGMVFVTESNV